jgi:Tfp pilus assembly protein PilP
LGLPEKKAEAPETPHYSPAGKRDPFQPLPLRAQAKRRPRENLSPLERYDLGQLQLVGIVWDAKAPRAMVEDAAGLGYVVGVGTAIGPNDGKIKEIKPAEVVIEETYTDFYGARKNRRVSMKLVSE